MTQAITESMQGTTLDGTFLLHSGVSYIVPCSPVIRILLATDFECQILDRDRYYVFEYSNIWSISRGT